VQGRGPRDSLGLRGPSPYPNQRSSHHKFHGRRWGFNGLTSTGTVHANRVYPWNHGLHRRWTLRAGGNGAHGLLFTKAVHVTSAGHWGTSNMAFRCAAVGQRRLLGNLFA
jgi:hypothetical protein